MSETWPSVGVGGQGFRIGVEGQDLFLRMPRRTATTRRRSSFFGARGVRGAIFPGELVCLPSPFRQLGHPRGLGSGWRGGRGSTWGRGRDVHVAPVAQAGGHLVSVLEPHCRELGVSQPVPPSLAWAGGPRPGRKVGAARVDFAQSLEVFLSCLGLQCFSTVDGGLNRCLRSLSVDGRV